MPPHPPEAAARKAAERPRSEAQPSEASSPKAAERPRSEAQPSEAHRIEELLRELGPRLRRGGLSEEPPARLPTGLAEVDGLLQGGFPRGRLSELTGAPSSGRTSLALALLARTTGAGEVCAVVDAADGFDPAAAEAAGVALERVLWARPDRATARRSAARLIEAGGFGLVLLDLGGRPREPRARASSNGWLRLARTVAGTSTALLVLRPERSEGASAEIVLEMRATRARFTGTPPLLEVLETEARLVRHRAAPGGRSATLRLRWTPEAGCA